MMQKAKAYWQMFVQGLVPSTLRVFLHLSGLAHLAKMITWLATPPAPPAPPPPPAQ